MGQQDEKRRQETGEETLWSGWLGFWETTPGGAVAAAVVAVVAGVFFLGNLSGLGIWEPWEANDILVAQDYQDRPEPKPAAEREPTAPSYNWAVPTREGKPVARSLLKTWLIAKSIGSNMERKGQPEVGSLEFSSRLPMALGALILALVGFFWLRDVFDTWSALLGAVAFTTTPAIYMGVHTLSAEMLFVVTTSLGVIAFAKLVWADGPLQWLWGVLFGAGLAVSFFDQRLVGLLVPLAVIVAFGLSQLPFRRAMRAAEDREDDYLGPLQIGGCVVSLLAAGGIVAWGFSASGGADGQMLHTWVKQVMAATIPFCLLLAGAFLAGRTRVIRRLGSPAGLLGLAIGVAAAGWVMEAYADANPTLLKNGELVRDIPVLAYALENHLFGSTFPEGHLHFAMWIREIGFSMVPWAAFVPLGIGYLSRSARLVDDEGGLRPEVLSEAESTKRLLLVWGFMGLLVVAGASAFGHYFFPAYFPLLAGVGLMFGDAAFWREARTKTLLQYFMGFAAIAILMMLGKDLERFPARLIETYMLFEEEVGLPEDFAYGEILDRLKYSWVFVSMTFFFGLVSWGLLVVRDIKSLPGRLWGWLVGWWKGESFSEEGASPARERAEAKEALRRESSAWGILPRLFETPQTFGAIITALFVGSAGIVLFSIAPRLGNHLSQRGIFETYTKVSDADEPLYRLRVSTSDTSVYLRNVETIPGTSAFLKRFDQGERFFAVIPRDELSRLNSDVRRRYDRNIPVLDARSSQILLISNRLEEKEVDQNFIAEAIVEDPSEIDHKVTFKHNGEQKHPVTVEVP